MNTRCQFEGEHNQVPACMEDRKLGFDSGIGLSGFIGRSDGLDFGLEDEC